MNETTTTATPTLRREGFSMGIKSSTKRFVAVAIAIAGLTGGVMTAHADTFSQRYVAGGSDRPVTWPTITPTTCTGDPCVVDLHAGTGSVNVTDTVNGNASVPFLGFGVNGGAAALAGAPTSTIKVPVGTVLTINFSQDPSITDPIELSFPSLPYADVTSSGNTYTVVASKVGTSVFQPGTNNTAPRQVALGLVGVLVVTPAACVSATLSCAYDPTVGYPDEAIVAATDLDLEFATNPTTFDMSYFGQPRDADDAPRRVYHVINGKSFPDTDVIDAQAGDHVLLRYVNAGVTDKSIGILGLHESLVARNASPYTDAQTLIAPLVGPGETADIVVAIPDTVPPATGQRYSLLDQGRQMNHGTAAGFGGAMTFLNVWPTVVAPPVTPPVVAPVVDSATFAAPDQLTINASSSVANVSAVEVSTGLVAAAPGTGTALGGTFGAPSYTFVATLTPAPSSGDTVWVRVQNSNLVWSDPFSVSIP